MKSQKKENLKQSESLVLPSRNEVLKMLLEIGMTVPSMNVYHCNYTLIYYCYPEFKEKDVFGLKIIKLTDKLQHHLYSNTFIEFNSLEDLKQWILEQWQQYINWIADGSYREKTKS